MVSARRMPSIAEQFRFSIVATVGAQAVRTMDAGDFLGIGWGLFTVDKWCNIKGNTIVVVVHNERHADILYPISFMFKLLGQDRTKINNWGLWCFTLLSASQPRLKDATAEDFNSH